MSETEHVDEGVLYLQKLVCEIRKGIEAKLELLVLNSAIIIPDICGSAENPGPGKSRARYIQWYKENVKDSDTGLYAKSAWNLRCKLVHEGKAGSLESHRENTIYTFLHEHPNEGGRNIGCTDVVKMPTGIKMVPMTGYTTFNAIRLCTALADACETWLKKVQTDEVIVNELSRMMRYVLIRDYIGVDLKSTKYGYIFENRPKE